MGEAVRLEAAFAMQPCRDVGDMRKFSAASCDREHVDGNTTAFERLAKRCLRRIAEQSGQAHATDYAAKQEGQSRLDFVERARRWRGGSR